MRIDHVKDLNEGYKPGIEGLDAKIIGIGQSINKLKDEIVDLVEDAVGIDSVTSCATFNSGICTRLEWWYLNLFGWIYYGIL